MDLETLLCSRDGFGLESATFMQRAICRITDGRPLDDLPERATDADREDLRRAIGCNPSDLPTGAPPVEVLDLEPVRCGKSLRMAALAVARSQTVDVSVLRAGEEPPRISVLSTQTDTATTLRGHLNIVLERPKLRPLVVGDTADSITLRHPSGIPVQVKVIAAQRGGYSLASRWSAGAFFDEAPGWYSTDKIVSLEESRDSALGRLLPGAQTIYSGSPWQPSGWCFETWRASFGRPSADLVVIKAGPAWTLNPVYWTPERVERVKRTSARTFRMHVLGEFGGGVGVYDFDAVEDGFRLRLPLRGDVYGQPVLLIDASSGKKDTWSFAAVQWVHPYVPPEAFETEPERDELGRVMRPEVPVIGDQGLPVVKPEWRNRVRPFIRFGVVDGFEGRFWEQFSAEDVVARLARLAARWGITEVHGDQRESFALSALFRRHGLRFTEHPYTATSKPEAVAHARRWFAERTICIVEHERMRQELHAFAEKPAAGGGFTFGARGSGYDDYACLVLTAALADLSGNLSHSPVRVAHGRNQVTIEDRLLGLA